MFVVLQFFFSQGRFLGDLFLKSFKRQSNSVGAQNIVSQFKKFSFIPAGFFYRSQVTGHRSQVTGHRSQVTGYRSQVTGQKNNI